jgi:hypothetical protein
MSVTFVIPDYDINNISKSKLNIPSKLFNNEKSLLDNCEEKIFDNEKISKTTTKNLKKAFHSYNVFNGNNEIDINKSLKDIITPNKNIEITFIIKGSLEELDGGSKIKIKQKFTKKLLKYSNPRKAQQMAYKYLGRTAKLYPGRNSDKKYSIFDPKNEKWVNFGQIGYEDYTKHKDKKRRKSYLTRSRGMLGNWKKNKYSANNLSIHILW